MLNSQCEAAHFHPSYIFVCLLANKDIHEEVKYHAAAGRSGSGMGHAHARGYAAAPDATIVALADLSQENARAFQAEHGGEQIYQDYREMLAHANLDIVSICTWPHLHAEMVIAAAEAGVKAIH